MRRIACARLNVCSSPSSGALTRCWRGCVNMLLADSWGCACELCTSTCLGQCGGLPALIPPWLDVLQRDHLKFKANDQMKKIKTRAWVESKEAAANSRQARLWVTRCLCAASHALAPLPTHCLQAEVAAAKQQAGMVLDEEVPMDADVTEVAQPTVRWALPSALSRTVTGPRPFWQTMA